MKYINNIILIVTLMIIGIIKAEAQIGTASSTIAFKTGSDMLYDVYEENEQALYAINCMLETNKEVLARGNGFIRLAALVKSSDLADSYSLNTASTQAEVVIVYLCEKYRLNRDNFIFYFKKSDKVNHIEVSFVAGDIPPSASRSVYYTRYINNNTYIEQAIAKYGARIPLLDEEVDNVEKSTVVQMISSNTLIRNIKPEVMKSTRTIIDFRHGSEILYGAYKENETVLSNIERFIGTNLSEIIQHNGHISIVSFIPMTQKGNPVALNFASMRGAVMREYLKQKFPLLTNGSFSFNISPNGNDNAVEVIYVSHPIEDSAGARSDMFFTLSKGSPEKIDEALARYRRIPYLNAEDVYSVTEMDFSVIDQSLDQPQTIKGEGEIDEKMNITIYYRFDKDNLDSSYMTNASTLQQVDSIMRLKSVDYIDSLRIVAFASPEGNPIYNQRLSERRVNTLKNYIIETYPAFSDKQTVTEARGENWEGFRKMVVTDIQLAMKEQILAIIDNPNISNLQRQAQIEGLDGGRLYKNYILPKYYRYLRNGASLFVVYNQEMPVDINFKPIKVLLTEPEPEPVKDMEPFISGYVTEADTFRYIRPFAIKTNLLFDAVTLLNIEAEFVLSKRFSLLGEWTFPFWGGLGNRGGVAPLPAYSEKYTLQMLSGGIELRYWFPRNKKLNEKAKRWGDYNPLNGWFIGLYGGGGVYDFQWNGRGMQGEFYIASGISAGYAHPIGKFFHLEYSLGIGYLATEYYNYRAMDGHKVVDIRADGKYDRREQTFIGPTKLKVSFIWIPRFKVKEKGEKK